ncbi:hypothetical protein HID58_001672, partial [Brassica napus]
GKVIDPAIKGVRNVLGSCLKSKSVKRVVFTSSISTLTSKDENERWRSILFAILSAVNKRMGSIGLVHVQDICIAHLFLMEEPKAEGQYICCVDNIDMHDLLLNHTFTKNFTRLFSVYRVDDDLEERPGYSVC